MSYTHLTEHERYVLNHLWLAGRTMTAIGKQLGRSTGTISRELQRNSSAGPAGPAYWDYKAHAQAKARLAAPRTPYKLGLGPRRDEVEIRLLQHHSPEQISGRLRLEHPDDPSMHISAEAIYLWAYRQETPRWRNLLRKKPLHRTSRKPRGDSKQGQIINRIGIEDRPSVVEKRKRLGDWESDTLCGEPGTGGIASHVERLSRMVVAAKVPDRTAYRFAAQSVAAFKAACIPRSACLTLTADNGKEFAEFSTLETGLGFDVYFADPHSPWQRGTNENTNGLMREYFPKGIDFTKVTKAQVDAMSRSMNNRPRKCLGYQTPREVFEKLAGVALQI